MELKRFRIRNANRIGQIANRENHADEERGDQCMHARVFPRKEPPQASSCQPILDCRSLVFDLLYLILECKSGHVLQEWSRFARVVTFCKSGHVLQEWSHLTKSGRVLQEWSQPILQEWSRFWTADLLYLIL